MINASDAIIDVANQMIPQERPTGGRLAALDEGDGLNLVEFLLTAASEHPSVAD